MQGGKREKACHLVSELNLVLTKHEDGRKGSAWVLHHKMEITIVRAKNPTSKEVHDAKKLAKQMATTSYVLPKNFPKHRKVERKRFLNPSTSKAGKEGHQQKRSFPRGFKGQCPRGGTT